MKHGFNLFFLLFSIIFLLTVCSSDDSGPDSISPDRLSPSDLEYLGAFRLPEGSTNDEVKSWAWGGYAMTFYPDGDSNGSEDGYPGSIFGTGHSWEYQVSEISIPVPVKSSAKQLSDLNMAVTLQPFHDLFAVSQLEIPRVGLAYLSRQGDQSRDKLYFCWGAHFQKPDDLTHGWCELDLSAPEIKKGWYLDCPHHSYNTNDYLFEIPLPWADANTPGKLLATGRFRDGGWSGQGPALFAIGPWNQGNPPPSGTALGYVTLLLYSSSEDFTEDAHTLKNYHHSDEWSGGVWLTAGNKSAVIFVGTKGFGECWYGDQNGPCTDCEGDRGWWSTEFRGQFIFYDSQDFARVGSGIMESWEPQPYATLEVDGYLYAVTSKQQKNHLGEVCFDRNNSLLYIFEPRADGDKPIIHVWKVNPE